MVAIVSQGDSPTGLAVVVSADGLLLAHRTCVPESGATKATLSGPAVFDTQVIGSDPVTGLVGLQILGWTAGSRPYAPVAPADPLPRELLVAATLAGPVQGQATQNMTPGRMGVSNRFVPLTEVRFEQSAEKVAGAILFNQFGQLVGVLGATLSSPEGAAPTKGADVTEHFSGSRPVAPSAKSRSSLQNYGPQGLTTAYVLGAPVLARVVKGLASAGHRVSHPTLGVTFREDAAGVRLTEVSPGSTASAAGLKVGDTVTAVNGRPVTSAVELAALLFQLEVGRTVHLALVREGKATLAAVQVAGS